MGGNLHEYRNGLIERIGLYKLQELDQIVAISKRTGFKHDRFNLISVILTYREKLKTMGN